MTAVDSRSAQNMKPSAEAGLLARMALALTAWTERWVPDAFVFALVATLIVIVAGVALTPSSLPQVIDAWGRGLWELIPFTLQMALIIITGHGQRRAFYGGRDSRCLFFVVGAGDKNPELDPTSEPCSQSSKPARDGGRSRCLKRNG